jgi:hypothetical protein
MKTPLIKHLPTNYIYLVSLEQHNQGNKFNDKLRLNFSRINGNFDYNDSILGASFWHQLLNAITMGTEYPRITKQLLEKIPKKYNLNYSLKAILHDKHLKFFEELQDNAWKSNNELFESTITNIFYVSLPDVDCKFVLIKDLGKDFRNQKYRLISSKPTAKKEVVAVAPVVKEKKEKKAKEVVAVAPAVKEKTEIERLTERLKGAKGKMKVGLTQQLNEAYKKAGIKKPRAKKLVVEGAVKEIISALSNPDTANEKLEKLALKRAEDDIERWKKFRNSPENTIPKKEFEAYLKQKEDEYAELLASKNKLITGEQRAYMIRRANGAIKNVKASYASGEEGDENEAVGRQEQQERINSNAEAKAIGKFLNSGLPVSALASTLITK